MTDPIRPTDETARADAHALLAGATFGAIAVTHPDTGHPHVTRIAVLYAHGRLLSLMSDLSVHTRALQANPRCSLLLGEPGPKGDPLTHPRITLQCAAKILLDKSVREIWVAARPKSALYVDFADFRFVAFDILGADLNAGFGKAYRLQQQDFPQ